MQVQTPQCQKSHYFSQNTDGHSNMLYLSRWKLMFGIDNTPEIITKSQIDIEVKILKISLADRNMHWLRINPY